MRIRRKALPQMTLIFRKFIFRSMGDWVMRIICFLRDSCLSVLEIQSCPFLANSLKVSVLNLMRSKENIEDLNRSSLTKILKKIVQP